MLNTKPLQTQGFCYPQIHPQFAQPVHILLWCSFIGSMERKWVYCSRRCDAHAKVENVNSLYSFQVIDRMSKDAPKAGAEHLGPSEATRDLSAEVLAAKAEVDARRRERGLQIAKNGAEFVKDTAVAGARALAKGVGKTMSWIGDKLSKGWSGLGKAAGYSLDRAVVGIGAGAEAKDYTVEQAGKAKDYTVEKAGAAKDYAVEKAGAAKDYVTEKGDAAIAYGREKITDAGEYVGEKHDNAVDAAQRAGRAIIESKAAKYTAKSLKYAGIGTGVAIGVPLAMGAYAAAGPLLAWKNPEALQQVRGLVKEKFPKMGMNVGEALEATGTWAAEKGREIATKAWGRMTGAWDKLTAWKNEKKAQVMESMGVASTEKLNAALDQQRQLADMVSALQLQLKDQNAGVDWNKSTPLAEAAARISNNPDAPAAPDLGDIHAQLDQAFSQTTQVGNPTAQA